MQKTLLALSMVAVFLAQYSCATQRTILHAKKFEKKTRVDVQIHQVFWLGGLFQTQEYAMVDLCPTGKEVVAMDEYYSWKDSLWTGLTLGIYRPKTTDLYCHQ